MSRRQAFFACVLMLLLSTWAIVRTGKTARGEDSLPATTRSCEDYSVNDEDAAMHRWAAGKSHHWRYQIVQR